MGKIKVGCQTYTWEMLGTAWDGSVDDILDILAQAGYHGVEITNTMIGEYYDAPGRFVDALKKRNLVFAAFGFVPQKSFTENDLVDEEIMHARKGIEFIAQFPGCRMDLAGGSSPNRENLDQKFTTMCCIYNEVAVLADERNVPVDVHPHSHAGSIIETEEEYDRLMELTDPVLIGWCPDSGHIVRGGLDLITTLEKYKSRIRNIHFKDVDSSGTWRMMGKGICDYEKTLLLLEEIGYKGWVIAEEESDEARKDQLSAVSKNRHYLKSLGY